MGCPIEYIKLFKLWLCDEVAMAQCDTAEELLRFYIYSELSRLQSILQRKGEGIEITVREVPTVTEGGSGNATLHNRRNTMVMIKVAPMGEVVTEVNVEAGSTVGQILDLAGVEVNGRAITVNNVPATENTEVSEGAVISLANKMKGGR